ncbi:hypothetical protein [Oscillibacter ruminantium]
MEKENENVENLLFLTPCGKTMELFRTAPSKTFSGFSMVFKVFHCFRPSTTTMTKKIYFSFLKDDESKSSHAPAFFYKKRNISDRKESGL